MTSSSAHNPFTPLLLVALAFGFYLVFQFHTIWLTTSRMRTQNAMLAEQGEKLKPELTASRTWQNFLEALANDVLVLGANDAEVRRVAEKYQIRRSQ